MTNFFLNALSNYKTTFLGALSAAALYIASLHGPHAALWSSISALALAGVGAVSQDAKEKM
jgi:hypothetical protein